MARVFTPRPDTVKIGVQDYRIEYLSSDEWEDRRYPDEALGVTFSDRAEITVKLAGGQSENRLRSIILHEITHAVWGETGLTHLVEMEGGLPDDQEEAIILAQSLMLLGVLRDNPHVVKYLTAKDR